MTDESQIDEWARCLARYHILGHQIHHSDCILALGTNDPRVADRAAQLYLEGFAPRIIFSGNVSSWTQSLYKTTEAEHFAKIAIDHGVPEAAVLIEPEATNTGENIRFSRRLIEKNAIPAKKIILVQKPYMERRSYATFKKFWPDPHIDVAVTSPALDFAEYPLPWLPKSEVINIIVGDLHRILEYPRMGFQIEQEVPSEVITAFQALVDAGYSKHLVKI